MPTSIACLNCGAHVPGTAKFCPSCGHAVSADAITLDSQLTELSPAERRTGISRGTTPGTKSPSSGWLSSADSISHGRFAPGDVFDGRYRIIGLLGRGGMGEVYRADDLRLGQPVALKLLPDDLRHEPTRLAQFHNEVRTARQVSHPNVCRVYDIGEADGLLYLSMEYVDGEDLSTSLRRIGRFPEDKASDLARQLCAGLAAAHQRGVIHRDLKPANVMLDGAGRVRIMDFGLAAVGHVEDVRAGTPAYMAPEQLLGREVTTRSDIFALGLVIYELFTGKRAFTATTVGELVSQHENRSLARPSVLVSGLNPGIERAILACLDPEPDRRPASALAVSAALPGGDPLAAALAAGETPSPEMVAAAGEGAGLSARVAWPVWVAVLAGLVASFAIGLRTSPLDKMRPEYTSEVLAQKARDAIHQLVSSGRPADEAFGFSWNDAFVSYVLDNDKPAPQWLKVFTERPSPLAFWYRQSQDVLTGLTFHTDLLTPGVVEPDDPPPITSGMSTVDLDHQGHLTYFEAIPAQRLDTPIHVSNVDWNPLFSLAGLDSATLTPTDPLWTWLATSDTRAAWTGSWPGSGRPLRVEAAALGGRPVAFVALGAWRKPSRMPEAPQGHENLTVVLLLAMALCVLGGAALLARANVRAGRGDQSGATRLAACMFAVLLAVWACKVHLVASIGLSAMFLVAVCTAVFYGVLIWTIYLALEPYVRKRWPQVLVASTTVLGGRVRDPVVGRDVLIGSALGVGWVLLIRGVDLANGTRAFVSFPGDTELLSGLRSTLGVVLQGVPYAIRNVLLYFFLLFLLRILLRSQWMAAAAITLLFTGLSILGNGDRPISSAIVTIVYFSTGTFAVLRWGLVTYAVGVFVSELLLKVPTTVDTSAWFFGNSLLPFAICVGLASWALYTCLGDRSGARSF